MCEDKADDSTAHEQTERHVSGIADSKQSIAAIAEPEIDELTLLSDLTIPAEAPTIAPHKLTGPEIESSMKEHAEG